MKFRARITAITAWVDEHYNLNAFARVKDAKDTYIEVNSAEEANDLETLNKIGEAERRQKVKIITTYSRWR